MTPEQTKQVHDLMYSILTTANDDVRDKECFGNQKYIADLATQAIALIDADSRTPSLKFEVTPEWSAQAADREEGYEVGAGFSALQPDSQHVDGLSSADVRALAAFKVKYPTWWWKLGWCDLTRDFDCAPQGHSPETTLIKTPGDCWDAGFSCDSHASFADAINDVMEQIQAACQKKNETPKTGEG